MEVESQESDRSSLPVRRPRKRKGSEMDEENEEGLMDQILPAAAAMKRRKIEEQEEATRNGTSVKPSITSQQAAPAKKIKTKKEMNIQEVVRERREAEEDAVRREEESLRESLDGMRVEDMKSLAVVEEMDLRDRSDRPGNQTNGTSSSRWDDAWNGRKNFKKFRRRGEGASARHGHSVIVPLEEVKKKDFGIGEEYWLEHDKAEKKRKGKDRATQETPSQSNTMTRSEPTTAEVPVPAELHIENDDPDTIDISAPRQTRRAHGVSEEKHDSGARSELSVRASTNTAKRAGSPTNGAAAKRAKLFTSRDEDDSDSDSQDELKFRFGKNPKLGFLRK